MNWLKPIVALFALLVVCNEGMGQVGTTRPTQWKSATPLRWGTGSSSLELTHNRREQILVELLDINIVRAVARSADLSEDDLTTVQLVKEPQKSRVDIYHVGRSDKAYSVLSERLKIYVTSREQGHTKECLLAATTNSFARISDPDLRVFATNWPMVPLTWLQKSDSGTGTNRAGQVARRTISYTSNGKRSQTNETTHIPKVDEVCRRLSFHHIDGPIGWRYTIQYKTDGSLNHVHETKCDATELDPRYQALMKEVDDACYAEMKRNGSFGKFGSVHTFWQLKKNALKTKGIEWRSPAELNRDTHYD